MIKHSQSKCLLLNSYHLIDVLLAVNEVGAQPIIPVISMSPLDNCLLKFSSMNKNKPAPWR